MITKGDELIRSLMRCIDRKDSSFPECAGCPYYLKDPDCMLLLMQDALHCILTAQDLIPPHVMNIQELLGLEAGMTVWKEQRWPTADGSGWNYQLDPAMRENSDGKYVPAQFLVTWDEFDDLNYPRLLVPADDGGQTRYWSKKPPDALRRSTPWKI